MFEGFDMPVMLLAQGFCYDCAARTSRRNAQLVLSRNGEALSDTASQRVLKELVDVTHEPGI
jgi:hypothetical protein